MFTTLLEGLCKPQDYGNIISGISQKCLHKLEYNLLVNLDVGFKSILLSMDFDCKFNEAHFFILDYRSK